MLSVLRAEIGKGLRIQLAHPLGHVVTLLISTTMYLGMQFVMGQGELRHDLLPRTLVGIAAYWFLQYAGLVMVADLIEDRRTGTYDQTRMASAPSWLPMLGRLLTASVFGLAVAVAATLVPALAAGISLPAHPQALLPAVFLLVNALAFTFLLASVALTTPGVIVLQSLLTALILLLNGSFLPLSLYPGWLAAVARLLPTTLGVEAVNEALFGGRVDTTLLWLAAYTAVLVGLSGVVFVRNQRKEQP